MGLTYNDIKPHLLSYWESFHLTHKDMFRDYNSLIIFQKRNIRRIKEGKDLIELRDIISEFYEYTNKDKKESFSDFRSSGKIIDSFFKK